MLAIVALVAGVYRLATGAYAGRYVLSMVPIALAYCAAHYVSLLLFTGQNAVFLASDPLGRGWDLFGTAGGRMSFFVSAEVFWYLQLLFVIGGHVAAIVLAHDRALVMKASAARSTGCWRRWSASPCSLCGSCQRPRRAETASTEERG